MIIKLFSYRIPFLLNIAFRISLFLCVVSCDNNDIDFVESDYKVNYTLIESKEVADFTKLIQSKVKEGSLLFKVHEVTLGDTLYFHVFSNISLLSTYSCFGYLESINSNVFLFNTDCSKDNSQFIESVNRKYYSYLRDGNMEIIVSNHNPFLRMVFIKDVLIEHSITQNLPSPKEFVNKPSIIYELEDFK